MTSSIKPWEARLNAVDPALRKATKEEAKDAEIAEMRSTLAKYEAQMLRMATCAGEFARDACKAQAPSAPPVAPDERVEFEAWCVRKSYGTNKWSGDGSSYTSSHTISAWEAWQARSALSVKAGSYPETSEGWEAHCKMLRSRYPDIAGSFKVFDIAITTEIDCKLDEGEYGIDICELVHGTVGEYDFVRIKDAVSEVIETLSLPDEGQTIIRVYESGEREDVFWNSYWRVAAPTPPTTGEA